MRIGENKRENMRILFIMLEYGKGIAVAKPSIKAYYKANELALDNKEC